MSTQQLDAEHIFNTAREKTDPKERAGYLDGACGNNVGLRAKVEALLAADAEAGIKSATTAVLTKQRVSYIYSQRRMVELTILFQKFISEHPAYAICWRTSSYWFTGFRNLPF